jgi:hypothetical protein
VEQEAAGGEGAEAAEVRQPDVALAAVALSITGYVVQDARNSSRQDTEIEATKARVQRLEQIATTNTEARIRTEVHWANCAMDRMRSRL